MEKQDVKRKRSENWREEDKMLLKELVRKKVKFIENKNTDTNSNQSKKKAWLEVLDSFNNLCTGGKRTITQLKNQWVVTKIAAKKEVAERRKEFTKTGGGSGPPEIAPSSNDITVWLPNEFVVDSNEFDSDAAFIVVDEDSVQQTSLCIENQFTVEDDIIPQEFELLEASFDVSTPKVLKKKLDKSALKSKKEITPKTNTTEYHIRNVAEFDLKCRAELHEHQLEVERKRLEVENKKLRNLDLESELIKARIKIYDKGFDSKKEDYI